MALLDETKIALRVTSTVYDTEIQSLIDAAKDDMKRVGVLETVVDATETSPLVKHAIICYCKAEFGFDNDEAERFQTTYRQCVMDLMNTQVYTTEETA